MVQAVLQTQMPLGQMNPEQQVLHGPPPVPQAVDEVPPTQTPPSAVQPGQTQTPPAHTNPLLHGGVPLQLQMPETHRSPVGEQLLLQVPQCCGEVERSTHCPLQSCWPTGQAQMPDWQVMPPEHEVHAKPPDPHSAVV